MSGGCPSCGVAVVPGYVKCPRCHAVMPGGGRFRGGASAGGTAVQERGFPVVPVAIGGLAVAVVLFLVLGGRTRKPAPPPTEEGTTAEAAPAPIPANAAPVPAAPPIGAALLPARPPEIPGTAGPTPAAVAAELERALGRQRLWSSVQASGNGVDVRSASCGEPAMGPMIEAARTALRGAGLTRLRCLAQSGAVVFERDL